MQSTTATADLMAAKGIEEDALLRRKVVSLSRYNVSDRQLSDLEQLLVGGFAPLSGFLHKDDYDSVVESMRLSDGTLWPMPITLAVPGDEVAADVGDELLLCDKYGNPIAILSVESRFAPDKEKEAQRVYGTTDETHPGVRVLFDETGDVYLGGSVLGIALPARYDFAELRYTPRELRQWFADNGWDKVVGFQTRNPIHRAHHFMMQAAARELGANVLVHPVVGQTKEGDIDYITRVRSYKHVVDRHMDGYAKLALLQLAMRMAGPREALWHALIRKNYGCTHFIVGRDHAGPGKDANGKPFYEPLAAQELAKKYEEELGIGIVPFGEVAYIEEEKGYLPADKVQPSHTVKNISGTQVRDMLKNGDDLPEWFSFPEVAAELQKCVEKKNGKGFTLFFTGLSGAGKSTIANIVYTKLLELQDRDITLLDGDVVRQHLSKGLGFSREDREANIERIGFVAGEITRHGGVAICSAIAPYASSRDKNRGRIGKHGRYIEIHVSTSLDVCKQRDTKGLYQKAEEGTLKNFTGIDDPYEAPENAELVIDAGVCQAHEAAEQIIEFLRAEKLIPEA